MNYFTPTCKYIQPLCARSHICWLLLAMIYCSLCAHFFLARYLLLLICLWKILRLGRRAFVAACVLKLVTSGVSGALLRVSFAHQVLCFVWRSVGVVDRQITSELLIDMAKFVCVSQMCVRLCVWITSRHGVWRLQRLPHDAPDLPGSAAFRRMQIVSRRRRCSNRWARLWACSCHQTRTVCRAASL